MKKEEAVASSFFQILSVEGLYPTPPALFRIVRSLEVSTDASPVDETFSVNAFCTEPAFAAIVPSVAPIDSATLVRIASFAGP